MCQINKGTYLLFTLTFQVVMGLPSEGAEGNRIELFPLQIQRISTPSIILMYSFGDWGRRCFNRSHS